EQDLLEKLFPEAASIQGKTPIEKRWEFIRGFQAGKYKTIISKGEVLGYGLNLQIATRHIFSACDDSWEMYHQCIMRSSRIGSTRPLNVHLPISEIERPQMENVMQKAKRIEADAREQER